MMAMTTYPETPERPVTRAEIDRLTAIIKHDAVTIRRLRDEIDAQVARADLAEALLRGRANGDAGLVVGVAMHER